MIFSKQTAYKCGFALILLIPFLLREFSPALQPYPALLLPSGANTVAVNNEQVAFQRLELFAVLPNQQEQALDPDAFFALIPSQYWGNIARMNFGLEPAKQKSIGLGQWALTVKTQRGATAHDRAETIRWLRAQLARIGCAEATAIHVRASLLTYDIVQQAEVKRETKWESYVDLETQYTESINQPLARSDYR